jgi:hypothetical protein
VLRLVSRNMPEHMTFRIWGEVIAKTATDPGWPFTPHDFKRHLNGARRKAEGDRERYAAIARQYARMRGGGS